MQVLSLFRIGRLLYDETVEVEVCDNTVGLACDDTVGLSDFTVGLSDDTVGLSDDKVGLSNNTVCDDTVGRLLYVLEHMKMWLCAFTH